jgi:hypothetical protein
MKGTLISMLLILPLAGFTAQGEPQGTPPPTKSPPKPGVRISTKPFKSPNASPKKANKQGGAANPAALVQLIKILQKDGVFLDLKKKQVRVKGQVRIVDDFLEYVLTGPRGKTHETLVVVPSKGSSINAALLALGLKQGSNCRSVPILPKPTEKEFREGAPMNRLIPPKSAPNRGSQIWLALSWKDAKGKVHTFRIEDLILDLQAGGPIKDVEWIYLGGRMAPLHRNEPPVFITDYAQNFVSAYYVFIPNHLVTIHHKRAANDQNWWPNRELLPPRGTAVELVFSLKPLVNRVKWKPFSPKSGEAKETKIEKSATKKVPEKVPSEEADFDLPSSRKSKRK